MGKGSKRDMQRRLQAMQQAAAARQLPVQQQPAFVDSLLAEIQDGNEYQSIVAKVPRPGFDLVEDVVRGIAEIEAIRGRPCLLYVGNVLKKDDSGNSSVDFSDDLPFREMVAKVPAQQRSVDVFLATLGGSAQQVNSFVNCLRPRFEEVDFLIPSFCMSAGTLFALRPWPRNSYKTLSFGAGWFAKRASNLSLQQIEQAERQKLLRPSALMTAGKAMDTPYPATYYGRNSGFALTILTQR